MKRDRSVARRICSERAAERGLPPFNPPPGWPTEIWSLMPLRAAAFAGSQGRIREFSRAAFRTEFVDGLVLDGATVAAAAREAGLDPAAVKEACGRPEVKQQVKDNTEEAIARGVPGIPTVAVGDELFWGDDRLDEAAARLSAA